MLGRELSALLEEKNLTFTGTDREVSILDPSALKEFAENAEPSWIVNCSGYTAVDRAESDKEAAFAINAQGVKNIASLALELDIPLIHISTDYVFDGTSRIPVTEDAPVSPVSVYGESKLSGENAIREIHKKHFIIRTAWLYGQYGPNFVYAMIKLMNARESIKVVDDQHGSPTWAKDLAGLMFTIISAESETYGTYHFSGEGECTWYTFARSIYEFGKEKNLITSDCTIEPCSSSEFPTPAKRPEYSLLSKEKVKKTFGFRVPDWEDSLAEFMNTLDPIVKRSRQWLELSMEDYDTAVYMLNGNRYSYVYFMCQQAVEKILKALVEFYILPPKTHNLLKLAKSANIILTEEEELVCLKLFRNYTRMRYPDLLRVKPGKNEAELILKRTGDFIWGLKTNPMLSIL